MSRIEEALKRAKADGPNEAPHAAPVAPGGIPSADVFRDAWAVAEPDADAVRMPRAHADAEPPVEPADERASEPVEEAPVEPSSGPARPRPHGQALDGGAKSTLALFQGFNPLLAERIVATPTIRPAFVEQYRRLAGSLHHAQVERGIRVLMVTSALAGEGKSLTATNLALTFSESYRRSVLLIDADLRRPTLHETFQVPNISGLGDGLRADQEQKLSLVQITPRLTLLTAGRPDPDPMSGLTSERMKRVVEEASARFDWVLIDTPPVGLLPDANLLAAMVDAALLVVQAGKTPYTLIQRAVSAVGRDRILGVVLNRAEEGVAGAYHYYSYYDHYSKKS